MRPTSGGRADLMTETSRAATTLKCAPKRPAMMSKTERRHYFWLVRGHAQDARILTQMRPSYGMHVEFQEWLRLRPPVANFFATPPNVGGLTFRVTDARAKLPT